MRCEEDNSALSVFWLVLAVQERCEEIGGYVLELSSIFPGPETLFERTKTPDRIPAWEQRASQEDVQI